MLRRIGHGFVSNRSLCQRRFLASQTKPYYITTPIFYPNAVPHIGHLYSLLIADIYYRFSNLRNPSSGAQFVTGTDEHGLKIQRAAQAQGIEPKAFCDSLNVHFRNLATTANISFTKFIRTSEEAHADAVQQIWRRLEAQDLIYKGTYSGYYSVTDETFYASGATIVDPTDTERRISIETGSVVEYSEETNYMLRLDAFRERLLDHYTHHSASIFPPQHHVDVIKELSCDSLEDISISRPRSRLAWGVQVPTDPEHTIYVWIDAVIAYLTAVGYPWPAESRHSSNVWPPDLQIIGKDIVRFHAIYLPAILLALDLPLPKRLLAHAHWTSGQKKMSKSLGNTTNPFEAMDKYGVDQIRYFMAVVGGNFRTDVDWSDAQVKKEATELKNVLGNFLLRITSSKIRGILAQQDVQHAHDSRYDVLLETARALPDAVAKDLDALEVGSAIKQIVDMLRLANKIMSDVEPWTGKDPRATATAFRVSVEALRIAGICLQPFIPNVARRLLEALGVPHSERAWVDASRGRVGQVKSVKLF